MSRIGGAAVSPCNHCGGSGVMSWRVMSSDHPIMTLCHACRGAGRLGVTTFTISELDLDDPLPRQKIEAGEIVGHRAWGLSGKHTLLRSVSITTAWEPGGIMTDRTYADCEVDDRGKYGVWAFKEKRMLELCFPGYVLGTVWMWGEVIEHEIGYRAQYARIRSLDFAPEYMAPIDSRKMTVRDGPRFMKLDQLRERYGVGGEEDADRLFPLLKEGR